MEEDTEHSKLTKPVKDLLRLIFDMDMMDRQMKEVGYDSKKMPLGKLSIATIKDGYSTLGLISKELSKKSTNKQKVN